MIICTLIFSEKFGDIFPNDSLIIFLLTDVRPVAKTRAGSGDFVHPLSPYYRRQKPLRYVTMVTLTKSISKSNLQSTISGKNIVIDPSSLKIWIFGVPELCISKYILVLTVIANDNLKVRNRAGKSKCSFCYFATAEKQRSIGHLPGY